MIVTLSLTEDAAFTVLRGVLAAILPDMGKANIVLGQINKVPQVKAEDFIVMWPLRRDRIETNVDDYQDTAFTASIAGTVMTVTEVLVGTMAVNRQVFGTDVLDNTKIVAPLVVNPDGTGTYTVSPGQTLSSRKLASGVAQLTQPTKMTAQVDVHGPKSADNAQVISTLLRDDYGVNLFDPDVSGVTPLYADDPRQGPYRNEQQQIENRWMVEAVLQINPTVTVPQQFADQASIELVDVDATYPIS